jgi:4-oxalocrotonate tautomerase
MPHIAIKLAPGRSEEQKRELTAKIVQDVIDVLHVAEDTVSLTMEEVDLKDWTEQVYQPEIHSKWDKLYHKPRYTPH